MNIHMLHRLNHRVNSFLHWIGRCWFWVTLVWCLIRAIFFWWLLAVLAWDFTDLLGIPLIQSLKAEIQEAASTPGKFFVKDDQLKIQAQIEQGERKQIVEWAQDHCQHIYKRNGLWNYFCPVCGKKLIPGDHPWWQI